MTDDRISVENLLNDQNISLEKNFQTTFMRNFTIYRRGFAHGHFIKETDKKFQLPDNSTLHFVTDFLKPNRNAKVNPDLSIPFIERESWRKFYSMYGEIPSANDPLFPVTDSHIFQKGSLKSSLMKFYNGHPNIKRIISDRSAGKQRQALLMYDYGILQRTNLPGTMKHYRMTDLIMRSMLHHITTFPYRRNHFIYIPLSDKYYTRSKFLQPFKILSNSTVKEHYDPSYDFLIHFFGFVWGLERPQSGVILSPNDRKAIEAGTLSIPEQPSTSLFNRLNDDQLNLTNVILEHDGEMVIYNLKQLKDFTQKGSFFNIVFKHVMSLKDKSLNEEDSKEYKKDISEIEDAEIETKPPKEDTSIIDTDKRTHEHEKNVLEESAIKIKEKGLTKTSNKSKSLQKDIPKSEPIEDDLDSEEDIAENIDDGLDETIPKEEPVEEEEIPPITVSKDVNSYIDTLLPAEQKRAKKLLEKINTVEIGGRTLKDHLETSTKSLNKEPLVGNHVSLIDDSTRSTPITTFDKQYLEGNYHADIAKAVTSFMTHGFFVYDISETHENTRINRNTTYKVKFVSVDGKQHTVSFTLPKVNNDGTMMDNGIEYRLIKQKVSVPIAKVSPWRVALFSSYNKSTVERTRTRRSYGNYILKILESLVRDNSIKPQYGHFPVSSIPLPLEYNFIAERYTSLKMKGYIFTFNYHERFDGLDDETKKQLSVLEETHGVYCGKTPKKQHLFFSLDNTLTAVNPDGKTLPQTTHFVSFLEEIFPDKKFPQIPYEYTLVKIISQNYSLIFLLGLIHKLSSVLKHIKAQYRFVEKGRRLNLKRNEIKIPFKNGTFIFNRYPLLQSFILSGLQWCPTEDYDLEDFDVEDTYFDILQKKGISTNQIKGIRSFFDFFIDPITKSVLEEMKEPTNTTDLLIRATEMLTTMSHHPASSERHYRFRSYERFPSIIYNEISRSMASYNNNKTKGKKLDVNPNAVYQKIVSDPARISTDIINPIHEIKDVTKGSYAGIGGRTSRSFVVNDRTYSPDSVGVISEATPDSGKVGMIFNTVMDPNIIDLYGRTIPHEEGESLGGGAKLMSVVGNLLPGLAQDDGKRANFTSIQLSHHVPCENGEINRIRTGTESLIAHMSSSNFAVPAPFSGTVTDYDEKHKLIEVTPNPMTVKTVGNLRIDDNEIDKYSPSHKYYRTYIPDGNYNTGEIYQLTKSSVGLITHIQTDPSPIPEHIKEKFHNKKLILVTFVLSPKTVTPNKTVFEYGEKYSRSQGTFLKQDLTVNVRVGDKVKKGDILIYNSGFFVPKSDPFGPGSDIGVDWKHGVMANIALLETSSTYEDACAITEDFGRKLRMYPGHKRQITLSKNTIVHQCVSEGDHVYSTDPAMTIEDGDLELLGGVDDPDTLEFFNSLSQQKIKMKYHGKIVEVDFLYGCALEEIHPTLRKLIAKKERTAYIKGKKMGKTPEELQTISGYLKPGSKYGGVLFTEDTVIVEITVVEALDVGEGDKLCIMTSNKTVVSEVLEKPPVTESGKVIDINFSVTSPYKRIVNSPFINGIGNQILADAEQDIIDIYND